MAAVADMIGKIKRYYRFSRSEFLSFIVAVIVLSFIVSFREWGSGSEVNLAAGLFNWFNAALLFVLIFIFYNFAQRVSGLSVGYNVEYKIWSVGLLIGVVFAFASRGRIWVLVPGGILIHHLAGHRLGHFRYDLSNFAQGMISVAGTVSLITLAALFKVLNSFFVSTLLDKFILICVVMAIYDILPIPPLTGSKLFFGSRMVYAFMAGTIIVAGILLLLDINVLMAIIGSIIIGIILWLVYYIFFEQKVWRGPAPKKWLK